MPDYILDEKKRQELDSNIREMISRGASKDDVMRYSEDFGKMFSKKKDGSIVSPVSPSPSVSSLLKSRKDIFQRKEASNKSISAPGYVAPIVTEDFDSQISDIELQIKNKGFDPKELDTDWGGLDIDASDDDLKAFYQKKKTKPLSAGRDIAAKTWHKSVRSSIATETDPLLKAEKEGVLNTLISSGSALHKSDFNTAISYGKNAIEQITALTTGENRTKAIEAFKKDYLPVLGNVLIRDKSAVQGMKDLPTELALVVNDMFNPSLSKQTRDVMSMDLSGNAPAQDAKNRRIYEMGSEGLKILSDGITQEAEDQGGVVSEFKSWYEKNGDRLTAIGEKIKSLPPADKTLIEQYNTEKSSIDQLSKVMSNDLENQNKAIESALKNAQAAKGSSESSRLYDIYTGEVDKYNLMVGESASLNERVKNLNALGFKINSSGISKEEIDEYNKLASEYKELGGKAAGVQSKISPWVDYIAKTKKRQFANNPTALNDEIIKAQQEYDGPNVNAAGKFMVGFGDLASNTESMVSSLFRNLFMSPDKALEADFEQLGRSQNDRLLLGYQKESDNLFETPYITVFSEGVKKQLNDIDQSSLSTEEKRKKKYEIIKSGVESDQIYKTTNPNAGSLNLTTGSVINAFATVLPQIFGAVGITLGTGGGMSSLALSTAMQAFSSYYNEATDKGISKPVQYATAHTSVDIATELMGTSDIKILQQALKGSKGYGASFFQNLTQGELDQLMKGSKRAFRNIAQTAKKSTLSNLGESGEEYFASIGGDLVNKYMFNENVNVGSEALKEFTTTSIGTMPMTAFSIPISVSRANIGSKFGIYNAAADLNNTIKSLKEQLDNGSITKKEYDDKVKLVNEYSSIIKSMPKTYADGNPMRDDDKAKYAFNTFIASRKKEGTIPPQQEAKIDEAVNAALAENDSLLENKSAQELSNIERLTPEQIEVTGDATEFANQMQSAQNSLGRAGMSVSPYAQEDYDQIASEGGKFLRAAGNKILALLKPNGEMVSLVKDATVKTKGAAQAMISKMKDMGGLFMDNYDIYLTPIYEKAGYKVVARVPFNEEYAPEGWNAEDSPLKNKPDVVYMVRNDFAPAQEQKFTSAEEAEKYTKSLVDNAVAQGVAKLPAEASAIDTALGQAIPKATKSLEKAGIKFQVVDGATDTDAAKAARGNQALFLSEDGTIIIDRSKLANDIEAGLVVWHEASHPVMNIIRNTNKPLYDAVVRGLNEAAKKNEGVAGALNWAQSQPEYNNEDTQNDEAIVETIGRINAGLIDVSKLDTGLRQKLIDFVNSIAKIFSIDPILNDTDIAAFKKTVSQVADALKTGRDIGEIVGQENVGRTEAPKNQNRAVTVAKGTESMKKFGLNEGRNTTRKIGEALEARTRDKYGIIGRNDRSDSALKKISSWMAEEVKFFINEFGENSGKGWYGEKFQKGIDAMSKIFPELATDQNSRDLFTMLVAITSDGTEVMQNFKQASMAYQYYKDNGKMPDVAKSQRAASYVINFNNIQRLLDENKGDVAEVKRKLLEVTSIAELNKTRRLDGLEDLKTSWPASFKVPLAAGVFGPKLGMFYANLSGMENYPTLDRWWSRTFNRYRGTLIPQITRGFNKKGEALGIDAYRQVTGLENASEDEVLAAITRDHDSYEDKGFKNGTDAEKKANTLYKKLFVELNDSPFGRNDRKFMYDAFIDTKKKLKASGVDVTIADIQAILWYFEKNLYKKLGVTKPIQGISYEDAANTTFEKWSKAGKSFDYSIDKSEEGETIEDIDESEEGQPSVGNRDLSQSISNNAKNDAVKTQGFFSDVVTGLSDKYKPKKEWKPILEFNDNQSKFNSVFNKYMGNFDLHIATSIPTFRETQVKVGNAITQMFGKTPKVANPDLVSIKNRYISENETSKKKPTFAKIDSELFGQIADYHKNVKDDRNNPIMKKSYRAFLDETKKQYDMLIDNGYVIEPWMGEGEPYGVDSSKVREDILNNKHLYYLRSRSATGEDSQNESSENYMPFESTGIKINGDDVLFNDLFRAVHDIFGHGMMNNSFSAQGELNAYKTHSQMYSEDAQKALFLETVVYNAYYANEKKYAPRKIYNIPDAFISGINQPPLVYDLGGSEGGFVKAITESSNGAINTINLDPNDDMQNAHESKPVQGSRFIKEAFFEGFEYEGKEYKRHNPKAKADVVHESMMFQFITPERENYIKEAVNRYLKYDGLFITEEKFSLDSEVYKKNEAKKAEYKDQYFTKEQQSMKSDDVLVGMKENQANLDEYKKILSDNFKYVEQYWDSGNFKGFVASNSKSNIDEFMSKVGSTESEFTTTPLKNNNQASVGNRNLAPNGKPTNLTPKQYEQVRTPQFKKWFGDWENDPANASKVVDENGEPLVVYHGSNSEKDFDVFNTGEVAGREPTFFSKDISFAEAYANAKSGRVFPVFLNVRKLFNPIDLPSSVEEEIFNIIEQEELNSIKRPISQRDRDLAYDTAYQFIKSLTNAYYGNWSAVESDVVKDYVRNNNYDGVQVIETGSQNIAVFDKNQIKSATGNSGQFSTTDNRIQASVGRREVFNKELPDSIINSVRASLRKKAPDSTTLQYLDELQQAKKDDSLLFEGPVNDMLENGVTLNDITSMLLDDEIFEDVSQVRNYFNNIGGLDGVGILTKASQSSVGNRSEDELRAPGTGKERDRALSSRFGSLDPETQAKIEDDANTYFQKTNKQTAKAVEEFIDGQNLVDMADYVLSNPDIPEVSKVWMAAEVAKRMNAEIAAAKSAGDQQLVDALTDKQSAIYNDFAKQATSLGQAVQAFVAFKNDPNAVGFFLPKILNQLKKAGAENVTEEQKADIVNLLRDVNSAADGLPKDKAIIKLSHYLGSIAPMKPMDVLQALWYAKILSGITTQSTNFFANVFNTAFELPAVAARIAIMNKAPLSLAAGVKGFGSGIFKGAVAAADIMKTGVRSKEVDKYFAESPLEYFTWSKWLGKTGKAMDYIPPVNFGAWKFIGRMLAATDALFSTANQEAIANMLAYAEAAGTPGNNNFRKANALLGNTKQNIDNAKAQATAEGFDPKSLQGRRRVIEIVAQGRKGTDEADAIGKRITMNYDPEGWTKPLFDVTVALQQKLPIIKMVIPFARIVANLTENGLNYSPLGLVKAATGKRNPFNKAGEKLSTEERVDLFNKFALGMTALVALAAVTGEDDDDLFEITAGGSNDVQKKYELQKGGWRPYTITMKDGTKINYKDWPIAGILAGIGHIRDAKKYSFDDSTQMGLYATGFFQNFYDKSLLSGLQDFFGIFNVEAGRGKYAPDTKMSDRAMKYAAQQVRSVAVSNLAQQTGKMYSELVTGDPQRDAKTFAEVIYRDLPMFNDGIRPIIDVFGDEVKYNTTERLTPKFSVESDEMIKWLNENKFFVGVPQKKNIIAADGSERPMTDDEYYEYRKIAGQRSKEWIGNLMNGIKNDNRDISESFFESGVGAARDLAYVEILSKYGFK